MRVRSVICQLPSGLGFDAHEDPSMESRNILGFHTQESTYPKVQSAELMGQRARGDHSLLFQIHENSCSTVDSTWAFWNTAVVEKAPGHEQQIDEYPRE